MVGFIAPPDGDVAVCAFMLLELGEIGDLPWRMVAIRCRLPSASVFGVALPAKRICQSQRGALGIYPILIGYNPCLMRRNPAIGFAPLIVITLEALFIDRPPRGGGRIEALTIVPPPPPRPEVVASNAVGV